MREQAQYVQLVRISDDDLDVIAGRRDQFLGRLQERYGLNRAEAERQIDEWVKSIRL